MLYHEITWRGTQRRFEVIFANVRKLPDESLSTHADERKVVVDFPFDEPGHTPADDLARLNDFRRRDARARTLVWLPSFLSASAERDLGTLVKIDHVLAGERLRDFATHLSPVDQASAREILRNQQSQLRQRLIHYLEGAYGVENPTPGSVDESHPPAEQNPSIGHQLLGRPTVDRSSGSAREGRCTATGTAPRPAHASAGGAPYARCAACRSTVDGLYDASRRNARFTRTAKLPPLPARHFSVPSRLENQFPKSSMSRCVDHFIEDRVPPLKCVAAVDPTRHSRTEITIAGTRGAVFAPEMDRVKRVVVKNARGHALYDLDRAMSSEPDDFCAVPLLSLTPDERHARSDPPPLVFVYRVIRQ